MGLPVSICPVDTVTLGSGDRVSVRGLSRAEAIQSRAIAENDGVACLESFILSCVFKVTPDEAARWYQEADSHDVDTIMNKVADLSGLNPDVGKA